MSQLPPGSPPLKASDVFVPGGLPTFTYNPRDDLGLEQRARDYLDEGHRILSLSGPTKSGKTVLLKSIVTNPIWVPGGQVTSADDLWLAIADQLQIFTEVESTSSRTDSSGNETSGEAGVGVVKGKRSSTSDVSTNRGHGFGRSRPIQHAALEALRRSGLTLVIDDFHFISPPIQLEIVRALKDPVFDGTRVVIASVPHRAFDAVRVEKEMTGRVEQLPIDFWRPDELEGIARVGFDALNLVDAGERLGARLAAESFRSPHLMQDFALQLLKAQGIRERPIEPTTLAEPSWEPFFADRAMGASKTSFDLLAKGPRQRSDRMERELVSGEHTDIYGAVLAAIAHTGPLTKLAYEELRSSLKAVMIEPPARHEVTRVLEEMAKIAREKIEGEPVVDYDVELSTLYISDPFFAYFLRWGVVDGQPRHRSFGGH